MEVWRLERTLTKLVYQHSKKFPDEEEFGLSSQIRRAAVSLPSNVAEGWGRHYTAEFIQFLRKANGSRTELETHLMICADVGLCREEAIKPLLAELTILGKQILALERSLQKRAANSE